MGLLSALFGGPSKSQIDYQIANLERQIENWKVFIAGVQKSSPSTPGQKRANQNTIESLKVAIANAKSDIASLKAQRKNAK